MNLKEEAQAYEPKQTKNISELDRVPVNMNVEDDEFSFVENGTEKTVHQKVIVVDGEKYKVPLSILASLKEYLAENPNLKYFKARKSGEGLKTKYTLIALGDSGVEEESIKE